MIKDLRNKIFHYGKEVSSYLKLRDYHLNSDSLAQIKQFFLLCLSTLNMLLWISLDFHFAVILFRSKFIVQIWYCLPQTRHPHPLPPNLELVVCEVISCPSYGRFFFFFAVFFPSVFITVIPNTVIPSA